jgi:general stress protein YciG
MAGTRDGGRKASVTNKKKYGDDFYKRIGHQGGSKSHPETRAFATNPELAKAAGAKGGKVSKRGPARKPRSDKGIPHGPRNKNPQTEEIKTEATNKKKGLFGWFSGRKSN